MSWFESLSIFAAIASSLLTIIGTMYWYIVKSLIGDLREVEKELADFKLQVSNTYAKSVDVKASYETLCNKIDAIQPVVNKMAIDLAVLTAQKNN